MTTRWLARTFIPMFLLVLFLSAPAFATDTLNFNGGGWWVGIVVSAETPTVVNIHVGAPGMKQSAALGPEDFHVVLFDFEKKVLHVEAKGPVPFVLDVKGSKGRLTSRGKTIPGKFDWTI